MEDPLDLAVHYGSVTGLFTGAQPEELKKLVVR